MPVRRRLAPPNIGGAVTVLNGYHPLVKHPFISATRALPLHLDVGVRLPQAWEQTEFRHYSLDTNQGRQQQLWAKLKAATQELEQLTTAVEQTVAVYQRQGQTERPTSQLAKLRQRQTAAQKRLDRTWRQLSHLQQQTQTWQPRLDQAVYCILTNPQADILVYISQRRITDVPNVTALCSTQRNHYRVH